MSVRTRIVGMGQKVAGDDGVGIAVLDELRRRRVPEGTELVHLADPMDLIPLLEAEERIVLVDAVLASPPGVVVELGPEELSSQAPQPASSHGMGAAEAIELARALSPGAVVPPWSPAPSCWLSECHRSLVVPRWPSLSRPERQT